MPDSRHGLMCLVTHFNNLVNSKEYKGKTSITPVQFSYGTNGNCYISFSPATKIEEVELFHSALASCIGISRQFVILRAGKWTKLMISHVPVWQADPITGEEHHKVNTKKDLMMLLQLFIPNDLLDKFPVQDVRFLRPLDYVCKTESGGHETIVLSVEDKSGKAFNAYTSHGLNFGYQNCYIRKFVDKVPAINRSCATSVVDLIERKLTANIVQFAWLKSSPPSLDISAGARQSRYAPALANVLRMEGFTGSRTPAPVHHSLAASGTSARTPCPSTTAPGLINTKVLAPVPPDTSREEDANMTAYPWWGPIGSLKNDLDSSKRIFGSVANLKWSCVSPPIDTQLPSNHPSTLVYIRKGHNISADMDPNSPACRHYYFIDIMVNDFAFKLCPVYLHSKNLIALAREFLQVPILESPTLICGDFNIQHPDLSEVPGANIKKSALGNEFLNWIQSNNLSVHNDLTEVTRVSPDKTSSSIIDYTLSNPLLDSYDVVSNWAISFPLSLCSDHGAISFDITCPFSTAPSRSRTSVKISEEHAEKWVEEFECYIDSAGLPKTVKTIEELENLAQYMLNAMSEATSHSMETKTFTDKGRQAPWWNDDCSSACDNLVRAKSESRPLPELKTLSSHLWFCIRRAKHTFFNDIIKKAHQGEEASTTNSIWEINRWWHGHKVLTLPTLKRPDSSLATSNGQKAALLHSTFFPHVPCSPPATLLDTFPQRPQFSLPPILESEIADNLALCHNQSAPGAFGTNYLLLKYHPICLRNALISPIPKPNRYDMASPKSYRPIALLETLSKLLEKIVAKHITAMASRLNLIPPDQFGGKEKSSCLDAGLAFVHDIQAAHSQKRFASAVLLDISGYYNNIDHDILVRITKKMGFPPEYSGWLSSYLTNRKACFRINGEIGNFFDLANRGVPQGSPLSPVFSSLFTAPLLYRLRSDGMNIRAYIDDIMILTTATSQEGCVSNLIDDIHDLTDALGDFGLSAEMSKTELIHFARTSHCMTKNLPVRLGDRAEDIVHPSEWVRWLGFFLDRRLNFKTHVKRLATRAKSMLGGMKMLGNTIRGLTVWNTRALINACLMPILTYGFALWFHGRNSKSLCKTLQTVQNMACCWATGSFRTAPTAVVEHVISLPPIQFRIRKLCANYVSKLRHVPANSQVNACLPPAFDSSKPDVAHPAPLSPINAISTYTHPQAEFWVLYLMLPWEGVRHLGDRISSQLPHGLSKKGKDAYLTSLLTRISIQETDPQSVVLFTDGSSIVKNGVRHNSWGWISFKQGRELSHGGGALGPCSTIYDAEAWALLIGLHNTLPFISKSGAQKLFLCSDNAGLIQALLSRDPSGAPSPVDMAARLLYDFMISHPLISADLNWVPSHKNVFGNKHADRITKHSAFFTPTPFANCSTIFARHAAVVHLCSDWRKHWREFHQSHPDSMGTSCLLNSPCPKFHQGHRDLDASRAVHTQIIRAITGHGRHAAYLFKCKKVDLPSCTCGSTVQDTKHIFIDCPRHAHARHHLCRFSRSINLAHMFSTIEGLQATARFLAGGGFDI
ncbi:Reverse transcriptase from mobile element jockey protein [Ceratobasidium theobromae]|uniref:Reverse transcriptase from mobile element jockey protein n=1 Tax=Ceratobasidium theobromae TaxID=1582974 RepID=A0A5N5QI97_9AGAM|nr:Reverse transcriptase from mobile element jockey protein [Ceratobasidium theobromae]